jgi:arsenate reductase
VQGFYVPRSDPDKIDVNVRCLDGVDLSRVRVHAFDGSNWEKAMTKKVPWRVEGGGSEAVLVLAYDGCTTCKNAIKWLDAHGVGHTVRPIVEEPPTEAELGEWIVASGVGVRKWLNTSGQSYRALGKAKVDAASDAQVLKWLAKDGKLVKRPVVVWGEGKVTVGFKEDVFAEHV